MRKIALLTVPLLVLGLAPLSAGPIEGAHELTIPTITPVESSDDMMMSSMDMMMDVEHTHDMGTADDMTDDVTHTHDTQTHMHDMGTADDMTDDVSHYHGEYGHTHGEEDMLNAPGHAHGFHTHVVGEVDSAENAETDDYDHYHLGGGFVDEHTHESVQAGPKVTLKGSSTLTFGIDLGTNATGFKNESEMDLTVLIISEQTAERNSVGMRDETDDLYAHIELKDFKWEVASAEGSGNTTAPSITTSLFMGPFQLETFNKPTVKVDYVDSNDDDKADGTDEDEFPGADFTDVMTEYKGPGLTLAYKLDPVMLTLGVVSEDDWIDDKPESKEKIDCHAHGDDPETKKVDENKDGKFSHTFTPKDGCKKDDEDDGNQKNAYAFIGIVNLDIGDNADLEAKVAYAHEYASGDDIGIGAIANFDLGDIKPHIAFDTAIPAGNTNIAWDVGGGVKWNLSEDEESSIRTDLMMHSPADGESVLYVAVKLVEGEGDDGALDGMGATLAVGLDDAAGDSEWNAQVAASYKVEDIKPYFDVTFGSGDKAETSFKAGLELTMIEHLTAKIEYASEDIGGADKGTVATSLKISY